MTFLTDLLTVLVASLVLGFVSRKLIVRIIERMFK